MSFNALSSLFGQQESLSYVLMLQVDAFIINKGIDKESMQVQLLLVGGGSVTVQVQFLIIVVYNTKAHAVTEIRLLLSD